MNLEWDWSSSHWNDRDGLGMTGLDQERRDEVVSQEVIRVSIPVILAPSRHSGLIRKYKNNGDDPRMKVEWDQAQGLSWQLSLSLICFRIWHIQCSIRWYMAIGQGFIQSWNLGNLSSTCSVFSLWEECFRLELCGISITDFISSSFPFYHRFDSTYWVPHS